MCLPNVIISPFIRRTISHWVQHIQMYNSRRCTCTTQSELYFIAYFYYTCSLFLYFRIYRIYIIIRFFLIHTARRHRMHHILRFFSFFSLQYFVFSFFNCVFIMLYCVWRNMLMLDVMMLVLAIANVAVACSRRCCRGLWWWW